MKSQRLLEALGQVKEEYIPEPLLEKQRRSRAKWAIGAAGAACLVLLGTLGIRAMLQEEPIEIRPLEADPSLSVLTPSLQDSTFGFEGYLAYDIGELVNGNPWREDMEIATLPVYENPVSWDDYGNLHGGDWNQMKEILLDTAQGLGLEVTEADIREQVPDADAQAAIKDKLGEELPEDYFAPTALYLEAEGMTLTVDQFLTVEVSLEPARSLPEGYTLGHYATLAEKEQAADWLLEQYRGLLGEGEPLRSISGGDYDYQGNQSYRVEFYPGAAEAEQQLLQYNFQRACFYGDDNGELFLIRLYHTDRSSKLGDYPILTVKEAEARLREGYYLTTVPTEFPGMQHVKKAELIYRTGSGEAQFLPYYRFYVELPGMEEQNGLRHYGAFYVPAVHPVYLSELTLWNGQFLY